MKTLLLTALLALGCALPMHADSIEDNAARNAKLEDGKKLASAFAKTDKPMLWLFLGDSITHGCKHTNLSRNFVEHFTEMIRWEHKNSARKGDIVINAGVSGETATGFLKAADFRLDPFSPSVVFIDFGVNDSRKVNDLEKFKTDMKTIITKVRKKKAIPVLMVPNLVRGMKEKEFTYYEAVRELAKKEKCLLVDHGTRWEEGNNINAWTNDALHPNASGHLIMGATIVRSLGLVPDGNSPTLNAADQVK